MDAHPLRGVPIPVRPSVALMMAVVAQACVGQVTPPADGSVVDGSVDAVIGADGDAGSPADADAGGSDGARDAVSGGGCTVDGDCDDGVACTVETCVDGTCRATPDDSLCADLEACDGRLGCLPDCGGAFCNLLPPECGCQGGDACYFARGSRICAPRGDLGLLESCAATNACVPGLACLPVLDGATGDRICHEICATDADCTTGTTCVGPALEAGSTRICSHVCNIATSAPCPGGMACRPLSDGVTTFCAGAGTVGTGETCSDSRDCVPNHLCGGDGSGAMTCEQICEVASPSCPGGRSCRRLTTPLVIRGTEFGVCI